MKKIVSLLIVACIMLTGCGSNSTAITYTMDPDVNVTVISGTDYSEYEYLEDSEPAFEEISFKDALKFFQNGWSGVLYFGAPTCRFCNRAVPVLNQAAKDCGITVYYINSNKSIGSTEEETNELYNEITTYIEDSYQYDENGVKSFYVPNVIGVHNGEMAAWKVSLPDDYNINTSEQMNDKQKQELYDSYQKVFASAYSDQ